MDKYLVVVAPVLMHYLLSGTQVPHRRSHVPTDQSSVCTVRITLLMDLWGLRSGALI